MPEMAAAGSGATARLFNAWRFTPCLSRIVR